MRSAFRLERIVVPVVSGGANQLFGRFGYLCALDSNTPDVSVIDLGREN